MSQTCLSNNKTASLSRKINADFAGFWHCPLSRLILVRPTGFSCFYSVFFRRRKMRVWQVMRRTPAWRQIFLLDRPTGLGGFVFKYGFAQRVWVFLASYWSAQRDRGGGEGRFFKYWSAQRDRGLA